MSDRRCHHCGALPDADGDHSCPCPHADEDCPDHLPGEGCDCTELCSMGPTCPGGMLARLPGSGCWRGEPKHTLFGSVCLCGEWSAQCGSDVPGQWLAHVNAATTEATS